MTYKMERKQGSFERGDSGVGRIRFSTDGKKVQIIINVKTGKDTFEEKTYVLDKDDCPENINLARNAKEWMLQMSSQGDKLMSFRPVVGAFVGKTFSFAAKEGEEPTPKTRDVDFMREGKRVKYSYDYFTVILDILEPDKFVGLQVPLILRYQFAGFLSQDGKNQVVGFSMGGKYTAQLEEYMAIAGILEDKYQPMTYKDNILPDMQRIALHEEKRFQFTMKDGWIVPGSLIPYDEPEESEIPFDADSEKELNPVPGKNETDFVDDDMEEMEEMDFEPEDHFE